MEETIAALFIGGPLDTQVKDIPARLDVYMAPTKLADDAAVVTPHLVTYRRVGQIIWSRVGGVRKGEAYYQLDRPGNDIIADLHAWALAHGDMNALNVAQRARQARDEAVRLLTSQ